MPVTHLKGRILRSRTLFDDTDAERPHTHPGGHVYHFEVGISIDPEHTGQR